MNVLSLFDGMSCGQLALKKAGVDYNVYYASEIDKHCIQVTQDNHAQTVQLGGVEQLDIYNLRERCAVNLLIGGSPCQDLSGLKADGKGLDGEKSRLLRNYIEIKNALNPKYFMLENVVPRKREWIDQINELTGVEGVLINSDLFVCQNRPRMYWTNIPIAELPERPAWDAQYYQWRRTYFRANKSGVCPCLTANMGTGGHNVPLKSMELTDKLTPQECEALQGVPANYTAGISNTQRYKMLGNGWTVPVIAHIFKGML